MSTIQPGSEKPSNESQYPDPTLSRLKDDIETLWERRESLAATDEEARGTVHAAIDALDSGLVRVAELRPDGQVVVNAWLKKAILLLFRLSEMRTIELGPFEYRDKIRLKSDFEAAGVRVVPGASARWGSFLEPGTIMMPSYVNIGARVGAGSMVDTWATVGSCAQIGERVHLAGGVGIGGVLEPPGATPVIIEDDAFIGSRCMIVDGARVGKGAKLGAGLVLSSSVPVIEAETGKEVSRGHIPDQAVAVAGTRMRQFPGGEFGLPCALILRYLDGTEHEKLQLENELRDLGFAS